MNTGGKTKKMLEDAIASDSKIVLVVCPNLHRARELMYAAAAIAPATTRVLRMRNALRRIDRREIRFIPPPSRGALSGIRGELFLDQDVELFLEPHQLEQLERFKEPKQGSLL
jgi:hypothetical protein